MAVLDWVQSPTPLLQTLTCADTAPCRSEAPGEQMPPRGSSLWNRQVLHLYPQAFILFKFKINNQNCQHFGSNFFVNDIWLLCLQSDLELSFHQWSQSYQWLTEQHRTPQRGPAGDWTSSHRWCGASGTMRAEWRVQLCCIWTAVDQDRPDRSAFCSTPQTCSRTEHASRRPQNFLYQPCNTDGHQSASWLRTGLPHHLLSIAGRVYIELKDTNYKTYSVLVYVHDPDKPLNVSAKRQSPFLGLD